MVGGRIEVKEETVREVIREAIPLKYFREQHGNSQ